MNADTPANQNPRTLNVNNCPCVIIGDNNVVQLQNSEAQGTGNHPGIDPQHEKVTSVHPDKSFHVPRLRAKELNDIESLFSQISDVRREDVVKTVYLTGPPGAGKTELARQYSEQFLKATSSHNVVSPPLAITLNARSKESLSNSVQDVTRKLRLSGTLEQSNQNLIHLIQKLTNYLRCYSGAWLLIVDDMLENNDFNNLFPRPGVREWGAGQVLVTTQDNNVVQACHQFARELSLKEGMTKEDALALLTGISGVEVDGFAEEIIKTLHHVPLALACCATYVGETRQARPSTTFGWKEYLELYRKNVNLESRSFSNHNSVYPLSMENAATLAVNRMSETCDVLRLTFSFLSYCDLLPVPLNVLSHYVMENLPAQNDERQITKERIENEISGCTLLVHGRSLNVETIKCHQVIYRAFQNVRNARPAEQLKIEFVKMMKSLNEILDFMDNTCKDDVLLKVLARPHLQLFVNHANNMAWNNTAEFVLLSMKNGQFLFSTCDMPEENVIKSLESLYNISLELDFSDERRCDILANLGFYYLELDRVEDALNFLCKAYCMTEGKSENEWLLLRCRISLNLARAYYRADSVDLAMQMTRISIDLAKEVYIDEEHKVFNRFLWLANFHLSWNKFWKLGAVIDEATEYFTSCSPDCVSLSRARSLFYLALIHAYYFFLSKNCELFEIFLNKSLNMYEQVLGADVSSCQEFCNIIAIFSSLQEMVSDELKTKFDKYFEISIQKCDKLLKNFTESESCSGGWSVWIRNLTRARLLFTASINMFDDILEDFSSGRISPSLRIINMIKKNRTCMVWCNYVFYLIFTLNMLFALIMLFYLLI